MSYEIGRRDRRTVEYVDERKRMDEHIDRWMNEQLNRWSDGQTDRGTHQRLWRWTMGKKTQFWHKLYKFNYKCEILRPR